MLLLLLLLLLLVGYTPNPKSYARLFVCLFVVALISILFLSWVVVVVGVVGVNCCCEPAKSLVVGVIFSDWLFSMFRSH